MMYNVFGTKLFVRYKIQYTDFEKENNIALENMRLTTRWIPSPQNCRKGIRSVMRSFAHRAGRWLHALRPAAVCAEEDAFGALPPSENRLGSGALSRVGGTGQYHVLCWMPANATRSFPATASITPTT